MQISICLCLANFVGEDKNYEIVKHKYLCCKSYSFLLPILTSKGNIIMTWSPHFCKYFFFQQLFFAYYPSVLSLHVGIINIFLNCIFGYIVYKQFSM